MTKNCVKWNPKSGGYLNGTYEKFRLSIEAGLGTQFQWLLRYKGEAEEVKLPFNFDAHQDDICVKAERLFFDTISRDNWETPSYIFNWFTLRYQFTVDACANAENAKCGLCITQEADGLLGSWGIRTWCNPPFSETPKWLTVAKSEAEAGNMTVMLLNYNLDADYMQPYIPYMRKIYLIAPRIQFMPPPGIKSSSNSKGQIAVVFTPDSVRGKEGPDIVTVYIPKPRGNPHA